MCSARMSPDVPFSAEELEVCVCVCTSLRPVMFFPTAQREMLLHEEAGVAAAHPATPPERATPAAEELSDASPEAQIPAAVYRAEEQRIYNQLLQKQIVQLEQVCAVTCLVPTRVRTRGATIAQDLARTNKLLWSTNLAVDKARKRFVARGLCVHLLRKRFLTERVWFQCCAPAPA